MNMNDLSKEEYIVDLETALYEIMDAAQTIEGLAGKTSWGLDENVAIWIFKRFEHLMLCGPSRIHYRNNRQEK